MLPQDMLRLHPSLPIETLDGGVDVSASLRDRTLVRHRGLLDGLNRPVLLTLAERTPPMLTSRLCTTLDTGLTRGLIAVDEGVETDETLPAPLSDRLAFHIALDGLGLHDVAGDVTSGLNATGNLQDITVEDAALDELVHLAVTLGISSLRAPSLALAAVRANAALNRRKHIETDDIAVAAELVYAPRATRFPEPEPEQADPPETPPDQGEASDTEQTTALPQDILLEAIKTALPAGLLDPSSGKIAKGAKGSGAGAKQVGNRRGRPLPARNIAPKGANPRVDLMATLRAAVPWQTLRRTQRPGMHPGPIILPEDLRYKRHEDLSDRLLIFTVDASGSAAIARLAEAKGAVELLLSDAYARRDHVALIAFRGESADVLLPPTRSLVQTKRRLADLPGGGGTPLAHGMKAAMETAEAAKRKGLSPVLILLTDGRSNIALDGTPDRRRAAEDVQQMAQVIAAQNLDCIVIDTSRRPERHLGELAASLRGRYVSLPRADAQKLSDAVSASLD
jgi:magnesium chelatase subunit D